MPSLIEQSKSKVLIAELQKQLSDAKKKIRHQQRVINKFIESGAVMNVLKESESATYRKKLAARKLNKIKALESCQKIINSDMKRKQKIMLMIEAGCGHSDIAESLGVTSRHVANTAYQMKKAAD